jgi:hypothetical protein
MSARIEAFTAGVAALAIPVAEAIPLPSSDALDAMGRWPLVLILAGICAWMSWLLYRQGRDAAAAMSEQTTRFTHSIESLVVSINHMTSELKSRPCYWEHERRMKAAELNRESGL